MGIEDQAMGEDVRREFFHVLRDGEITAIDQRVRLGRVAKREGSARRCANAHRFVLTGLGNDRQEVGDQRIIEFHAPGTGAKRQELGWRDHGFELGQGGHGRIVTQHGGFVFR